MVQIPLADFLPDYPDYENPGATLARNVVPGVSAGVSTYRPLPSFATFSGNALAARCQGAVFVQTATGLGRLFFGDATKLYVLDGSTIRDVSRSSGGAYATPSDGWWSFALFGDLLIATNGVDAPQKFDVTSVIDGTVKFVALGGSPPSLAHVAVIKDFLFFAGGTEVAWSAINNAESYSGNQADSQILPNGGLIRGIVGGEAGLLIQQRMVRKILYEGPPTYFRIDPRSLEVGADIAGSIASWDNLTFFASRSGFKMIVGGEQIVEIGKDKVDKWFWETVDTANLHRVSAAFDPATGTYRLSFPTAGSGGAPDTELIFERTTGRWSTAQRGPHEIIFAAASQTDYDMDEDFNTADQDIDADLPSLDSELYAGVARPAIGAFDTAHMFQFENGANLAAVIHTGERQLAPGQKSYVRAARPICDGGAPTVTLGLRNSTTDAIAWGTPKSPKATTGLCRWSPRESRARYHRARITIPAGALWSHVQGIDGLEIVPVGSR